MATQPTDPVSGPSLWHGVLMRSFFVAIRSLMSLGGTLTQHWGKVLLAFSTGLVFCLCAALQWSQRPIPTRLVQRIETTPLLLRALPSEAQPGGTTGESASDTSIDTGSFDSIRREELTSPSEISSQIKVLLHPHPAVGRTAGRKSTSSVRRSGSPPEETKAEIGFVRPGAGGTPQLSWAALLPIGPSVITVVPETPLPVRLLETLSSQQNRTGDSFRGQLASPLLVKGVVVAPLHAPVLGRIVDAHQAGLLRGHTNLNLELTQLTTTSGQLVSLQTTQWYEAAAPHIATRPFGAILGAFVGLSRPTVRAASPGPDSVGGETATSQRAQRQAVITLPAGTTIVFRLWKPVTIEAQASARSRP